MEYYTLIVFNLEEKFPEQYFNDDFNLEAYTDMTIHYNISQDYFNKLQLIKNEKKLLFQVRKIKINNLKNKNYQKTTYDILLIYLYNNINKITYSFPSSKHIQIDI